MRDLKPTRPGFTIVELLVAAALTMAIMAIIGVAFQKSVETFRVLRSVSQMQNQLKSAQAVLTRDLASEHFSGNFKVGFGGPYVRDQRLDLIGWVPPDEGFFRIIQLTGSTKEGTDSDGLPSYYATNHALHFTVRLRGNRDEEMFYASGPNGSISGQPNLVGQSPTDFQTGGMFASRWAEVYYFLVANGQNANGTPLYTLYRRQRLALGASATAPAWSSSLEQSYPDISWSTSSNTVNTAVALTNPTNRLQAGSNGGTTTLGVISTSFQGDDILLANVLSFEVRANWTTGNASSTTESNLAPGILGSSSDTIPDGPFAVFPTSPWNTNVISGAQGVFDSWSTQAAGAGLNWDDSTTWTSANLPPPLRVRVNSLQIRIRIWDANAQQARQFTMVQEI